MYHRTVDQLNIEQKLILSLIYGYFGMMVFIVIPVMIFHYMEDWSVLDGVYFVIISLTTIGFGDYTPNFSQVFTVF